MAMTNPPNPVIKTSSGFIQGEDRDGVAIFRGIPYGDRCSGMNRFQPPKPAPLWESTLDCTHNGPIAMQQVGSISGAPNGIGTYFSAGNPERFGVNEELQCEDCLVLNVLSPGLDDGKRPVLVYIHGGGFANGSGSLVIGADQFCREQNIVLVGVNHRLNVFGYLYLGALDDAYRSSGMAGIQDLILALQWVQENIAQFGGDPASVTIMGESGGAMKVSTLLAMPCAKGLFCRAVVESGSSPVGVKSREEAASDTLALLQNLGLTAAHWRPLLELPAESILQAANASGLEINRFVPVADDKALAFNKSGTFYAPPCAADVPLLVGSSEDELAAFMSPSVQNITWGNMRSYLSQYDLTIGGTRCVRLPEEKMEALIALFQRADTKRDDADHLFLKILSLSSMLGTGAYEHAMTVASRNHAPVYAYLVRYDAPDGLVPGKKYAWHTADLPLQLCIVLHKESEHISQLTSSALGAFVRTGDPSTGKLVWPSFDTGKKLTMVIDNTCVCQRSPLEELITGISALNGGE